ncbi:hypothetical protein, partial [Pseudoalteromonas sp. Q36-MNA-CIBAN-0048]|uniref:hypothetical protein n=1 Tax=Pseudoalteromonas sp. Q36-MNA-CIBAN-0048 TaxID=3140479 RepID=UPI003319D376
YKPKNFSERPVEKGKKISNKKIPPLLEIKAVFKISISELRQTVLLAQNTKSWFEIPKVSSRYHRHITHQPRA